MSFALNKPKLDDLADDIRKSAERLKGTFKSYEYQTVILPTIVIRRLECVLIGWREKKAAEVLKNRPKLTKKELDKLVKDSELIPKQCPFTNTTDWTFRSGYEKEQVLRMPGNRSQSLYFEHESIEKELLHPHEYNRNTWLLGGA